MMLDQAITEQHYTDVMLDLETLGTKPGSVILSIGAVTFAPSMPEQNWRTMEVIINREDSKRWGLTEDLATIDWWSKQEAEARVLLDWASIGGKPLCLALAQFANFFPVGARLWGNGGDFDSALLGAAYEVVGAVRPWQYYDNRCFRTMKNEFSWVVAPEFVGVKHSAISDALHQTRWLEKIRAAVLMRGCVSTSSEEDIVA